MRTRLVVALLIAICSKSGYAVSPDWTTPIDPFHISGGLYYVGSRDLAAYLVVTSQGNILINANLESSPALIRRSVEHLGFKWVDTKIVLSSQAHYDHAAGAAEVIRETHAQYMVMEGDAGVIQSGGATDFDQSLPHFPPARVDRLLHDLDTVSLGGATLIAHKTAGHTRGCTTWTMQTHEGGRTLNIVIVGGWAANPGVRLAASHSTPASYPGIAADFERTFVTLAGLPCDIFLGAHGVYFGMLAKLDRVAREGASAWIDPYGYRRAVAEHEAAFHSALSLQSTASRPSSTR